MKHNIEGDIRNCIEVANGDYNLSHLDEPMLKYYNELVAKARAFDEIVNILKDTHSSAYDDLEDIQIIINEYMEDKQND
jgi:hypothetical protein